MIESRDYRRSPKYLTQRLTKNNEVVDLANERGLARQSVGRVSRLEGTVEGGGFPHERYAERYPLGLVQDKYETDDNTFSSETTTKPEGFLAFDRLYFLR